MVMRRSAQGRNSFAFASVVGRLVGGVVATRVQVRGLTAVLIVVQASALLFLALAETQPLLLVASALLGLSVGNLLMLQPLLLVEAFGVKHTARKTPQVGYLLLLGM